MLNLYTNPENVVQTNKTYIMMLKRYAFQVRAALLAIKEACAYQKVINNAYLIRILAEVNISPCKFHAYNVRLPNGTHY